MKRFIKTCLFLLAVHTLWAQSSAPNVYLFSYFKNNGQDGLHLAYSYDGYTWEALNKDSSFLKPTAGKDKLMRDPCIIRGGDGYFHMVWTVSWNEKGIGYARSKDLVNWSAQEYLPVMEHEPETRNSWAPEITYDTKKKEYMIYWASTITGRFPQTDTAAESKYNHRIYYATTKDFKKFSPTKLLYDPGFSVIDASIVKDGNRYVMFLKNETRAPVEKNIRVAFAQQLTGPYGEPSKSITGAYWAEGPTAIKINNQWIVYFDKYTNHMYGAVTSTNLISWTDISDKIRMPKGIRHGTVFTVSRKEFEKLPK
ncbi:MAG: glycoside hydrolase family 43 protein [Flavisolibacter sp.]|nr:glycoside hydrolase family 43 protein [Flavisolibacter sp.]MBD0365156.1 glycoside hydrolase family 43 protein [Flavisolibacter sp.]MBD0377282.1 glycoside hydrolase family 43 protein [Flavisolibacter sp.]